MTEEHQESFDESSTCGDPKFLVREFLDLKFKLEKTLQCCNPQNIIDQCTSLMASDQHNIPLFSAEFLKCLMQNPNSLLLIKTLGPYFTWSDHSILNEVVDACGIPKAKILVAQFEAKLDFSKPLLDYPVAKSVHQMLPNDNSTHTVLAVQLDLELQQLSLQDVFDTRNFILKKCEVAPHTLQLLSVAQGSSTILYWMISRCVVPLVTSKVSQNRTDLHQKGILHVAIYPSTILATGKALSVGPLSFLTCFDEMVSVVHGKT